MSKIAFNNSDIYNYVKERYELNDVENLFEFLIDKGTFSFPQLNDLT